MCAFMDNLTRPAGGDDLEEYARMVTEARKALDEALVCFAVAVRVHERARQSEGAR